jgi:hypothetical protein
MGHYFGGIGLNPNTICPGFYSTSFLTKTHQDRTAFCKFGQFRKLKLITVVFQGESKQIFIGKSERHFSCKTKLNLKLLGLKEKFYHAIR